MLTPPLSGNIRRIRTARGLTQQWVANAAGISRIAYRNIENGKTISPRVNTLQQIAKALSSKLENLVNEVPRLANVRFRANKRLTRSELARRDQILVDVAVWLRNYGELEELLGDKRPYLFRQYLESMRSCPAQDRAKHVAEMARKALKLNDDEPIRDIPGLLGSAGIKVRTLPSDIKKFFGLSVGEDGAWPAIVVNTHNDIPVERRIFTAAHELGHLLLHPEAYNVDRVEEANNEEKEADSFAGHFLMPDTLFHKEWKEAYGQRLVLRVLHVKRICRVSYKTVLHRLVEQCQASQDIWKQFNIEYRRYYGKSLGFKEEPWPVEDKNEPLPLEAPDFVEDRLSGLVRGALEQGVISLSRGAEILDLSLAEMRELLVSWKNAS